MPQLPARLVREQETVEKMVHLYCRQQHHPAQSGLCPACQALLAYATERLKRCIFQAEKPTCAKCPVHCYQPVMRQTMRQIMRYAGPRMLFHHPVLAIRHLLDGRKPAPVLKKQKSSIPKGDESSQ